MEKLGVENLKAVLNLGFAAGKVYKAAKADGKIDIADLGHLMILLPVVQPAIKAFDKVGDEIKDLDGEEVKEVLDYSANELAMIIDKEELLKKINLGLKAALACTEFALAFKGDE